MKNIDSRARFSSPIVIISYWPTMADGEGAIIRHTFTNTAHLASCQMHPSVGPSASVWLVPGTGRIMANRVADVNRALRIAGHSEKLVRGAGYYYFADGTAPS